MVEIRLFHNYLIYMLVLIECYCRRDQLDLRHLTELLTNPANGLIKLRSKKQKSKVCRNSPLPPPVDPTPLPQFCSF